MLIVISSIEVSVVCIKRDGNSELAPFFIKCRTSYVIRYIGMLSASFELVTRFSPFYLPHSIPLSSELLSSSGTKIASVVVTADSSDSIWVQLFPSSISKRLNTLARPRLQREHFHLSLDRIVRNCTILLAKFTADRLLRDTTRRNVR